jgi:hypothetical protein
MKTSHKEMTVNMKVQGDVSWMAAQPEGIKDCQEAMKA